MAASPESYQEVINALTNFASQTKEQCDVLKRAAEDCVDNTMNDPNAQKASEDLNESADKISKAVEEIEDIIKDLKEELQEIIDVKYE